MAISDAQKRATAKYHKKSYDRIELKVRKGNKEVIEEAAQRAGMSVNSYIAEAVNKQLVASGYDSILTGKDDE